jgi:hypothetical protein
MGRQLPRMVLAEIFAGWLHRAETGHRIIRDLVVDSVEVDTPDTASNGSVTLRVPYIVWQAARAEAGKPPPEPVTEPEDAEPEGAPSPNGP